VALVLAVFFTVPAPVAGETLPEVYRRVVAAVVVIRARGDELTAEGVVRFREIGSGVLISPDGKIATAAHVVHTMNEITVEFLGEEPVPAHVLTSDQLTDVAMIQASVVPRDAVVSPLTDSDVVHVGDPVFIVGAPYGLHRSLSAGIISARWEPDTAVPDFPVAEFFQTDAAINTGNSGGPMFSREGRVIGIVSHNISKSGGFEGLGFVITANTVRKVIAQPSRYSGLDMVLVTGAVAQALDVPQAGGYLVKKVIKNALADKLGLRGGNRIAIVEGQQLVVGGDIILSVQGVRVASLAEMTEAVRVLDALEPGQLLRITILRDKKVQELSATR
jgi:S1-C subfamily serine protease